MKLSKRVSKDNKSVEHPQQEKLDQLEEEVATKYQLSHAKKLLVEVEKKLEEEETS